MVALDLLYSTVLAGAAKAKAPAAASVAGDNAGGANGPVDRKGDITFQGVI